MAYIYKRTHMCGELRGVNADSEVALNGWIQKRRNLGGLIFCDLRDKTGIVQIVFDENIPRELFEKADRLRGEFVVGLRGVVRERKAKNAELATGDVEVFVSEMEI
ncbi:MAG: Asp-tRNA(Asn)/Glu-tRNA(Gln) amidotransferase GatCAB subunit C, partial [Clostridiales Family XIII bacterium]|nr:Asp-tRNA(Asn)/Glu-tRNA(Gln) amidotransferase GatCAB subunit C [Clostridiales Family XIII bacterium]